MGMELSRSDTQCNVSVEPSKVKVERCAVESGPVEALYSSVCWVEYWQSLV